MTVDGTDFQIEEPTQFDRKWYSHKFKGPGLRYELYVCVKTGDMVAYHRPFPCGSYLDIKVYRLRLRRKLSTGEKVISDGGYKGGITVVSPDDRTKSRDIRRAMRKARARHETINGRLKNWKSLRNIYRHSLCKHNIIF